MNQKLKVEVPHPCHKDWNTMFPVKGGRHCTSCNKEVVDFTVMTDQEIVDFFRERITPNTCGHFMSNQLTRQEKNTFQKYFLSLYDKASSTIKHEIGRVVVLFFLGTLLTLFGCRNSIRTTGEVSVTDKPDVTDTSNQNRVMGKVAIPDIPKGRDSLK